MLERVLITLVLIAVGVAAYCLYNHVVLRRLTRAAVIDPLLLNAPDRPTIVYFTTPFCVPCRTQQQPALAQLLAELDDAVHVIQVDATVDPAAADRWGVFSAPTTFVLDRQRRPRHVNRGVASAAVLRGQLADLAPPG